MSFTDYNIFAMKSVPKYVFLVLFIFLLIPIYRSINHFYDWQYRDIDIGISNSASEITEHLEQSTKNLHSTVTIPATEDITRNNTIPATMKPFANFRIKEPDTFRTLDNVTIPTTEYATRNNTILTTMQPFANVSIKEPDTFTTLDNEPYFYVRSAYLEYRHDPPRVQILAVMGSHLLEETENIRCRFMRSSKTKSLQMEVVAAELRKMNNPVGCYFKSVQISCSLSDDDAPDYVSISYKEEGKRCSQAILLSGMR